MSPNDYLKTLRMNRAAELIMGGTRISEVAVQVGLLLLLILRNVLKRNMVYCLRNIQVSLRFQVRLDKEGIKAYKKLLSCNIIGYFPTGVKYKIINRVLFLIN